MKHYRQHLKQLRFPGGEAREPKMVLDMCRGRKCSQRKKKCDGKCAFWGEMNTFLDALRAQHLHPAQKHLTDERPERPRVVCSDACHMINEGRPPWGWLWGYLGLFIGCFRLEETSGWEWNTVMNQRKSTYHTFTCCSRRSPQTWNHTLPSLAQHNHPIYPDSGPQANKDRASNKNRGNNIIISYSWIWSLFVNNCRPSGFVNSF